MHRELTYEEVLRQDPDYCDFFARARMKPAARFRMPDLFEFVQHLQELGLPSASAEGGGRRKVGFGMHKDLTYEEALDQHPDYCDWAAGGGREDDTPAMAEFASWLREAGRPLQEPVARGYGGEGDWSAGADASRRKVGFGKYQASWTWEEVRSRDPDYCWQVLEWTRRGIAEPPMAEMARWLQERGFSEDRWGGESSSVETGQSRLDFGHLQGWTFQNVSDAHPEYCRKVLEWSRKGAAKPPMERFARWLQEASPRAVDGTSRERVPAPAPAS